MKKITFLLIAAIIPIIALSQQTVYWRSEANNGNWWNSGSGNDLHWYRSCDGWWIERPDYNSCNGNSLGATNIIFGNNSFTTMSVNGAWFQINNLTFESGASASRTLNSTNSGGLSFRGQASTLENKSSATHIFNTEIGIDGTQLTMAATNGGFQFNNSIYINSNALTITGEYNTTISGIISGTGALTKSGSGVLYLSGANSYTGITAVTSGVMELQSDLNSSTTITVETGATLRINGNDIDVLNLTINSGGTVEIVAGKSLTVNGTLTNNGALILKSNSTDGTATLKTQTTVNNGGSSNYSVEQYLTSGRNWYISSPVTSGTLPSAGYEWNEAGGVWANVLAGASMTAGKGYIVQSATDGIVTFSGTLNNNITSATTLNRTTGVTKEGFNLVGNPYPSYLNWNSITKTNLSATMWYRTREGSTYKFYTYNGSAAGYGQGDGVGVPAGVTNLIPPVQAFWVRVESGNATGTIGFENAARAHKDIAGNILKAPAATNRQIIRLTVSNGENTDETLIYTNSNATSGLDTYDSPKMMNATAETPDLYTIAGTEKLVINGLNALPLDTPIPLGLAPGKAGTFSISANELTNIDSNTTTAILHDAQENANFDLSTGQTYDFATDGTATESRFSLILRSKGTTTGTSEPAEGKNMVYVDANRHLNVVIKGDVSPDATIQIYTVTGQLMEVHGVTHSVTQTQKALLPGTYIIKLKNSGMESIHKITIR
jgi:autotransporter-associated beta strand protein